MAGGSQQLNRGLEVVACVLESPHTVLLGEAHPHQLSHLWVSGMCIN